MSTPMIVVGVDESAGAAVALRWAVAEADLRAAAVVAVLAWGFLDQHQKIVAERFDPSYGTDDVLEALCGYITATVGAERAAAVRPVVACDLPARALLDASHAADLLVVGARGLGGFEGLLLGSVSQHCLHHTSVPIAIVRPAAARSGGAARVVVGVDGSDHAQHALRWALDEAHMRKAHLDVVTAWQLPHTGGLPSVAAIDPILYERTAQHIVADAIAAENTTDVATPIAQRVIAGHPADVLLDAAADSDLLVVGSRGHGAFKRALLGSVATNVSHHATCPVVVVPVPYESTP